MSPCLQEVFDLADQIVPPSFDGQIVLQINFSSHETLVGLDDSGFSSVMAETSLPLRSGVFHELLAEYVLGNSVRMDFDFPQYLEQHIAWSEQTFGSGVIADDPDRLLQEEFHFIRATSPESLERAAAWIDVIILAIDRAQRCLKSQYPNASNPNIAELITHGLTRKQQINMQTQPIEHVRGGEL